METASVSVPRAAPFPHTLLVRILGFIACLAILAAVNLFLFWPHWRGKASFPRDFPKTYYAIASYWITSVEAGEWPHWVPYQSMGYPFAMNLQTGLFYPPYWVFPLLDLPYTPKAAVIFQVVHVFAGAVGMFLLGKRLFRSLAVAVCASVCFHLFGGFYSNAPHPDIVRSFALLPWVLWTLVLDRPPARFSLGNWSLRTRLGPCNLLLPLTAWLFITGSYPGSLIAGLMVFGIIVATQALCGAVGKGGATPFRDGGLQLALLGLGVLFAAAYLVPGAALKAELSRSHHYAGMARWYLVKWDLLYLLFPSNAVYSRIGPPAFRPHPGMGFVMLAMQVPLVLVGFILLLRPRDLPALLPFLAAAAFAAVMGLAEFRFISERLIRLLPPLGWSRFPSGDYRIFLYLGLFLPCLAGLNNFLSRESSSETARSLYGFAALATVLLSLLFVRSMGEEQQLRSFVRFLVKETGAAAGILLLACLLRRAAARPLVLGSAICLACVLLGVAVVRDMESFWLDRGIMEAWYGREGKLPLKIGQRLRLEQVFQHQLPARPARKGVAHTDDLPWRGYLEGSFMKADHSNTVSVSRTRVEGNPVLARFLAEPSRLVALDPRASNGDLTDNELAAERSPPGFHFTAEDYRRNEVRYRVQLEHPALVVENELYAPGWSGALSPGGERLQAKRVAGALRGWALPAGNHQLTVRYRTPRLALGLAISASALASYALICAFLLFQSPQIPSKEKGDDVTAWRDAFLPDGTFASAGCLAGESHRLYRIALEQGAVPGPLPA